MTIRLRGHHLLCLLGFRGMGYSEEFCVNMTAIYERLRTEPDTEVEIITGPDDICRAYPPDKPPHCEGTVYGLDERILAKLGLAPQHRGSWRELCARIAEKVVPGDIARLCATCPWEKYGVCREGVGLIIDGLPLPKAGGQ
ncbi:DUF1284 domain-containing protein [Paenibacillus arenilitoris]|uniref:DUF1284 domain-containing protein n=1 Tax=Paenibacillus arenilitoris TaxID=2772299 RepID=A0A927CL59_9BACL|nr:DUF1284 domain-containing protein [Paenibacillus arenilitoris]MBD2868191.1 DUF1284 domain-containing protein [Paenibacillus arenilitoris]